MSSLVTLFSAERAFHRLLWDTHDSLVSWASDAVTAVLEHLPPNCERSGYRHDTCQRPDGVVLHQLVELDSGLPVCFFYESGDGYSFGGFGQPWAEVLARFINAIVEGDLLVGPDVDRADPTLVP
jgi:hypothetical protein